MNHFQSRHTHTCTHTSVWLKPRDMGVTWHRLILRKLTWHDISNWKAVLGLRPEMMQSSPWVCVCGLMETHSLVFYFFLYYPFFLPSFRTAIWKTPRQNAIVGWSPLGSAPGWKSEGPAEANYITGHSSVLLFNRDTTNTHGQTYTGSSYTKENTWHKEAKWRGEWVDGHAQTNTHTHTHTHRNSHAWLVKH